MGNYTDLIVYLIGVSMGTCGGLLIGHNYGHRRGHAKGYAEGSEKSTAAMYDKILACLSEF